MGSLAQFEVKGVEWEEGLSYTIELSAAELHFWQLIALSLVTVDSHLLQTFLKM